PTSTLFPRPANSSSWCYSRDPVFRIPGNVLFSIDCDAESANEPCNHHLAFPPRMLPAGLPVQGVVLADHLKSAEWQGRGSDAHPCGRLDLGSQTRGNDPSRRRSRQEGSSSALGKVSDLRRPRRI